MRGNGGATGPRQIADLNPPPPPEPYLCDWHDWRDSCAHLCSPCHLVKSQFSFPISPHFYPLSPISPHFSSESPFSLPPFSHFPPFSCIFPLGYDVPGGVPDLGTSRPCSMATYCRQSEGATTKAKTRRLHCSGKNNNNNNTRAYIGGSAPCKIAMAKQSNVHHHQYQ